MKATPAHLQFWSNRHAELHGIKPKEDSTMDDNRNSETTDSKASKSAPAKPLVQSYANPDKNCCYLCSRQFKTTAEVNKHERLSDLHRTNLKDEALKTQALAKLKKAGIEPRQFAPDPSDENETPEYRDRARERRQAFGSSAKKISLPMKKSPSDQGGKGIKNGDQQQQQEQNKSSSSSSKGAALLGKMGWTSGQGLGAQGEGMRAPIATEIYAAGVGLGAEGGKVGDAVEEAARETKGSGYEGFLERGRERARGRFEAMK